MRQQREIKQSQDGGLHKGRSRGRRPGRVNAEMAGMSVTGCPKDVISFAALFGGGRSMTSDPLAHAGPSRSYAAYTSASEYPSIEVTSFTRSSNPNLLC